jgi:hypothetical protein
MWSGTTFNKKSGKYFGVHQRIDRLARHYITSHLNGGYFPTLTHILHFEGKNGPDGIKRKLPSTDELWHFIDPGNPNDQALLGLIHNHHINLVVALKNKDEQRAAFEAAWLAHAVVDGLTPAHHYPLEDKLAELRGGQSLKTRTTLTKKIVLPGKTPRQRLHNNWEYWGARGVMTSHYLFEWGVAGALTPTRNLKIMVGQADLEQLKNTNFETIFRSRLLDIHKLNMYEAFCRDGWTSALARQTRRELIPAITNTVILAWLNAAYEARR